MISSVLGFLGDSVVKTLPANAGDMGLIPELGRSPGEGNATHFSILACEIPWTEEPGGLQSMGLQRVAHNLGMDSAATACLNLSTCSTVSFVGEGVPYRESTSLTAWRPVCWAHLARTYPLWASHT